MAKLRIPNAYTFDASAKTIVHASFSDITLAGIQLIVNVTDQIIIYNFADPNKGGTLATDTLTLDFDTTAMSDTDELMILVEDGQSETVNLGAVDNAVLDAIAASVAAIDGDTSTIIGHVDGLETLIGTTNSTLTTIDGRVDGIETLIGTTNSTLTTIDGRVDGIETLITSTNTKLDTTIGHLDGVEGLLTTIDTDTGNIATAVQLIDDTIFTAGTDTYTEATSKGQLLLAVRRDADTTLANTTNEFTPLQVDANGYLKVEVFSGATLPVSLTSTTITGTVAVTQSGTWDEVGINDSGNSITVDNGGTFVVQENGAALTALQLLDDAVYTDDTSTHATGTSKGYLMMAAATPTDAAVNANDIGALSMTVNRELLVSLSTALPAGTNGIGKLTANSGVDIGDVDVTSVTPGTTATSLGKAEDAGHTSGDVGVFNLGVRVDTPNTALTNTDADYSPITTNKLGSIRVALNEDDFAVAGSNHVKKYYTSAGAATDGIVWSPAAGKRWYVTDIFINVSAAATVTLEDDLAAGDSAVWKAELAANSGWSHSFTTPLFSGEDAADLLITTTAGNVYVTVTGYEI